MTRGTLAAALVLLSVTFACQGKRKKVIAVIPKATSHLFWVSVHGGAAAAAAGIPVAVFDSGLDSDNYTTFVATDNYEAGQSAARTLAFARDLKRPEIQQLISPDVSKHLKL